VNYPELADLICKENGMNKKQAAEAVGLFWK
jgi:hypothetical protein